MVKQLTLFGLMVAGSLISLISFNPRSLHVIPRSFSAASTAPSRQAVRSRNTANYRELASSFEVNVGQADPRVRFIARGTSYRIFLTNQEAILLFPGPSKRRVHALSRSAHQVEPRPSSKTLNKWPKQTSLSDSARGFRFRLVGANGVPEVQGLEEQPGKSNYLIGEDPTRWHMNVPHYARVKYSSVYPGIDLVYYLNKGLVEYDFVIDPYADAEAIRMSIRSLNGDPLLHADASGDLIVQDETGRVRLPKPIVYQPGVVQNSTAETRSYLNVGYIVKGQEVAFKLPAYDHSRPLIIDPAFSYATFLGGTGYDQGNAIAVDSSEYVYVVGQTASLDFPTVPGGLQTTSPAIGCVALYGNEAFVSKLDPSGTKLIYSTYLGGAGCATATGIAVDLNGSAYVTGSAGVDFPTSSNAFQKAYGGSGNTSLGDGFVAKLNATGTQLVYSTYLGGNSGDIANGIALDSSSNAYIIGQTFSSDFPTVPPGGSCSDLSNSSDFVTKVNSDGSALVYSRCLGKPEIGFGIAVSAAGNAYVTGSGNAGSTTSATGSCGSAGGGGYIAKLNADGTTAFVDCFPGTGMAVAVDENGDSYLTGYTASSNFPTTPTSFQPACSSTCQINGFSDAFAMKLDSTGTTIMYGTYLGGSGTDVGNGIAVDSAGDAFLTGYTSSADFPVMNPVQGTYGGGGGIGDALVTELDPSGSSLLFSTFLGGSKDEVGTGIALDVAGSIYATGSTASAEFPVTTGSFQTSFAGPAGVPGDAFVVKFGAPDFSLAASAAIPNKVTGGQTATATVTVKSIAGFNSEVSLSCSVDPSPSDAPICSISPSGVTPPPNGSVTASLTITTTAPKRALAIQIRRLGMLNFGWFAILGMTATVCCIGMLKRRCVRGSIVFGLLLAGLVLQSACGSGSSNSGASGGTPKGNYTVTITGTNHSLVRSAEVALAVE